MNIQQKWENCHTRCCNRWKWKKLVWL